MFVSFAKLQLYWGILHIFQKFGNILLYPLHVHYWIIFNDILIEFKSISYLYLVQLKFIKNVEFKILVVISSYYLNLLFLSPPNAEKKFNFYLHWFFFFCSLIIYYNDLLQRESWSLTMLTHQRYLHRTIYAR